nr:MAG TPA: hypothetical protein [Siphovirus LN-2020-2]
MICKKDVEDGTAFWTAAIAEEAILPGIEKYLVLPDTQMWYLLDDDEEYLLYPVERIQSVEYRPGSKMIAHTKSKSCASYSKKEYDYELANGKIVISERKTLAESFLRVIHPGKSGLENLLDTLDYDLELLDEKKLTALQYELDMFREDYDDFLTPEQVEWFDGLYDIVASELDARWLLKKLEERRIVKIERSN